MTFLKNKTHLNSERIGELAIVGETILYSSFPIIIKYAVTVVPPIFFAALSTLIAAAFFFLYLVLTKNLKFLTEKSVWKYILGVTVFIIIIPQILIYTGSKNTSGINTSLFLQSEVVFTFLIAGFFLKEKISGCKIMGVLAIILANSFVILKDSLQLNWADLLIISGTFFYPLGNICAKKAMHKVPSTVILFLRSLFGGLFLLLLSWKIENLTNLQTAFHHNQFLFWAFLWNGFFIFFLSKIWWYEGLKRLSLAKCSAIAISAPTLSIIFAIIFLDEIPTFIHICALLIIMAGVYLVTTKTKKEKELITNVIN